MLCLGAGIAQVLHVHRSGTGMDRSWFRIAFECDIELVVYQIMKIHVHLLLQALEAVLVTGRRNEAVPRVVDVAAGKVCGVRSYHSRYGIEK